MHIRKVTMPRLTRQDFERLLEFRVTLRRFHRWSEDQAQAEGLTHVQHQLLVAIKGHHENQPPTMGDLAGYLMLRPHSTVELVDRAEAAGLVERTPDGEDGRVVRVRLTRDGDRVLTSQRFEKSYDHPGRPRVRAPGSPGSPARARHRPGRAGGQARRHRERLGPGAGPRHGPRSAACAPLGNPSSCPAGLVLLSDTSGPGRAPRMPLPRSPAVQPVSSRRRGTSSTGRPAPSRC